MSKLLIIGIITFSIFTLLSLIFAQETITITTYYPSPSGSYREMNVTRRQAIGDVNNDGQFNANDMAVFSAGDLYGAAGSLIPASLTVGGAWGATTGGRVGIATTTPRARLDVRGTLGISAVNLQVLSNICVRVAYGASSGTQNCPAGYNIAGGSIVDATISGTTGSGDTVTAAIVPTVPGYFICCQSCIDVAGPDFNADGFPDPDGICD